MRKIPHSLTLLALPFWLLSLSSMAAAQCSFRTLNIPGEGSSAIGINDQGAIVGAFLDSTTGQNHGYLVFKGRFTRFSFPGSLSTEALGINSHGVIVGDYLKASRQHGFMVLNGSFHSIDAPGATSTRALGINKFGSIVGERSSAAGVDGFVRRGTKFTTIHVPSSARTSASGINDHGVIVGSFELPNGPNQGFILSTTGKFRTIDFPGADNTTLTTIDNAGEVLGNYTMHGETHGFSFANGNFTTIDEPNAGVATIIFAVNNFDQIVGSFVGVPATNKSFTASCSRVF